LAIIFRDRREAGRLLGSKLSSYAGRPDVVVLGLPRGGVPVAFEVAKTLKVPLDVLELHSNTMVQASGIALPNSHSLCHFSRYQEVVAWPIVSLEHAGL